jgi:hypothetical protein
MQNAKEGYRLSPEKHNILRRNFLGTVAKHEEFHALLK